MSERPVSEQERGILYTMNNARGSFPSREDLGTLRCGQFEKTLWMVIHLCVDQRECNLTLVENLHM
jgi:hypothetical protein